jgi:hypothetical protein
MLVQMIHAFWPVQSTLDGAKHLDQASDDLDLE